MTRTIILMMVLLTAGRLSAQEAKLLGDGNDGNRSMPVHLLELFDEDGKPICAGDKDAKSFSTRTTCGQCHDYEVISGGWHFSGHRSDVPSARVGQPWVLTDAATRSQIPVSGRDWPGTFKPEQVGVTAWDWVIRFGSHYPGGSYGELTAEDPEQAIRQNISGKYEINCLACHNADPRHDASLAALQAARQNYRWVAAASSGKAMVNGTASALSSFFDPEFDEGLKTTYLEGVFDKDNKVFFDIAGKPQDRQCYFCHSWQDLRVAEHDEWTRDVDVHSASGLRCVDCHRHGADHKIARGVETEQGPQATLSCRGCHIEHAASFVPQAGRLGAPMPRHWGIPTIHFEKMTCTACHSGTWPQETAGRWRTARMHKLGLHGKHKQDVRLPHIYAPVLLKGSDGKIGSYAMIWPAFWATLTDAAVEPIPPAKVMAAAGDILSVEAERQDDWRPLSDQQVRQTLARLKERQPDATPVYIAGGLLYQLEGEKGLTSAPHPAAGAYSWPMAHDVRAAAQSLGVRGCADCHTTDSPFFFGGVPTDTPLQGDKRFVQMVELQGIDRLYMWAFNASFVFRPMLKIIAFLGSGLIGLVLLVYALKALVAISRACVQEVE